MRTLFADTFYWAALLNPRDEWHSTVKSFNKNLVGVRLVTTDEVLTELLNFFSAYDTKMRQGATQRIQDILQNDYVQAIPQTHGTFLAGLELYRQRIDKEYSLTDQRLWISNRQIHTYPDLMVVKTPLEYQEGRRDTLINPVFIAEVLSKSTKSYDRDEKFAAYRTITSFQEYILIDQYKMHVEQYFKTDNNKWIFSEYEDGDKVDFNIEE
jgi:Uma2 family endonuclease